MLGTIFAIEMLWLNRTSVFILRTRITPKIYFFSFLNVNHACRKYGKISCLYCFVYQIKLPHTSVRDK